MAKHAVWRENTAVMAHEKKAWHARLAGCCLAVSVTRDGVFVAIVERKRADDGGFDTIGRTMDARNLVTAQQWCESTARRAD